MARPLTRILSDLHYGDRATSLKQLETLRPLFLDATALIFNGDFLDTRPSPDPAAVAAQRKEVQEFVASIPVPVTLVTGNHDPDVSPCHFLELANRQVFVTHGDILFRELVPWSRDAPALLRDFSAELARHGTAIPPLPVRLAAARRAAARIPQRHQTERNGFKYLASFLADTVWPPSRVLRILRAWHETPRRASALMTAHRLPARFLVMGHTHRVGAVRAPGGLTVLNTGSFCPPGRTAAVDLEPERIVLREVGRTGRAYSLGRTLAEFPLAPG